MFRIQKFEKIGRNANVQRTIRFPDDLYEQYNKVSNDTGVSFNALVVEAMKYAIKDLEIVEDNNTKK